MKIYEFFVEEIDFKESMELFSKRFYDIGDKIKRKVDGETAGCVYGVSRNLNTGWVQLLVDDNTPRNILDMIEAEIEKSTKKFVKYSEKDDHKAPLERKREEIGI